MQYMSGRGHGSLILELVKLVQRHAFNKMLL